MEYDGVTTWNGITRVRVGVRIPRVNQQSQGIIMKYDVKVTSVDIATSTVEGTCDGKAFRAEPFFWGGKSLMKVVPEFYSSFQQGEKVAIGQAAKSAIRTGGGTIPEAPGKEGKSRASSTTASEIQDLKSQIAQLMALVQAQSVPQTPESEVAPEPEAEPESQKTIRRRK